MEIEIQKFLDVNYEDYIFLGRTRDSGNVLDFATSEDEDGALDLLCDLQLVTPDLKWKILDAALKVFTLANDDDYALFLQHLRLAKRGRMDNVRKGLIPVVGEFTPVRAKEPYANKAEQNKRRTERRRAQKDK